MTPRRIALLHDIGCIVSRKDGRFGVPCEFHHPTSGGRRLGDDKVIPMSAWHHRGVRPADCATDAEATEKYGPSLAHGRKPFEARYGSEQSLLEETERLLELYGSPTGAGG